MARCDYDSRRDALELDWRVLSIWRFGGFRGVGDIAFGGNV